MRPPLKKPMCSQWCLQQLRKEITAARSQLEKLVTEERSFKSDLFGTGGLGRPRRAGQPRKRGRPAGRKTVTRGTKPRQKGLAKADKFLAKLPAKSTIDDVQKVAGRAAPISLAQWARAKKVKKVAGGYQKVSQG